MNNKISEDQELMNEWGHAQLLQFKRKSKLLIRKSKVVSKAVIGRNWKKDYKNIENAFNANKALLYGASNNVPYSTLIVVGQLLSNKKHTTEIKKILKDNVIVIDGLLIKLDDLTQQKKIRKAIRTLHFDNVQNFAA